MKRWVSWVVSKPIKSPPRAKWPSNAFLKTIFPQFSLFLYFLKHLILSKFSKQRFISVWEDHRREKNERTEVEITDQLLRDSLIPGKMVFNYFNSHSVGIAAAWLYGFWIDFWETLFLDKLHNFSLLSLNSSSHPFLQPKFMKKILDTKNISFSK